MSTHDQIAQAAELSARLGYVLVATADEEGWAHIATAGPLQPGEGEQVVAAAWFCPATVQNVQGNTRVSLVAWDPDTDEGLQLLGHVERVEEKAVLDGYRADEEAGPPLPQVERELCIRVDKALRFSRGPHTDKELSD